MCGKIALEYLIKKYDFKTVLDVGSGSGEHSKVLRASGKEVTEIDFGNSYYSKQRKDNNFICGNYLDISFVKSFDVAWCCHVLEHQLNPNLFLEKVNRDLKEGGILAITVPPLKHNIVGGHVSLWNGGLLLYQLIMAGFDCRNASIKTYGYNISVILRKKKIELPALTHDCGDLNRLSEFFPKDLRTNNRLEGFDGNIKQLNWKKY